MDSLGTFGSMNINVLAIGEQLVTVVVKNGREPVWVLSAVYASPRSHIRASLWEYILWLGQCINFPRLLLGDLNQILLAAEKWGGNQVHGVNVADFQSMVARYSLFDLGFFGVPYTWSNLR